MGRIRTVHPYLPPRMLQRKSRHNELIYYYYCTKGHGRKEIALGNDFEIAMSKYSYLEKHIDRKIKPVPENYVGYMYRKAKNNAKSRNIDFNITQEELKTMLDNSKGKCSLTNIRFNMENNNYKMPPWIPSLDRINSDFGYSVENCRIVCCAVNLALNQFGFDVLKKIAISLKRTEN